MHDDLLLTGGVDKAIGGPGSCGFFRKQLDWKVGLDDHPGSATNGQVASVLRLISDCDISPTSGTIVKR